MLPSPKDGSELGWNVPGSLGHVQTADQSGCFASSEGCLHPREEASSGISGQDPQGQKDGNDEVLELSPALLAGHSPRSHHKLTHASLQAAEGLRQ